MAQVYCISLASYANIVHECGVEGLTEEVDKIVGFIVIVKIIL